MGKRVVIIIAGILLAGNYLHSQHKATDNYIAESPLSDCSQSNNLVPNCSFEVFSSCNFNIGNLSIALFWVAPTIGTSDYFNSCAFDPYAQVPHNAIGYCLPNTGNAYGGVILYAINTEYREYIQVPLTDSLKSGKKYFVEFHVSLADSSWWAVDAIGAHFSDTAINRNDYSVLNYAPQINNNVGNIIVDKESWTKISGSFTALGGEKYLTIGNFMDDVNTLKQNVWEPPSSIYNNLAYYYIDDVYVGTDSPTLIKSVLTAHLEIQLGSNHPNPFTHQTAIPYQLPATMQDASLEVYDMMGKQVLQKVLVSRTGSVIIQSEELPEGVYIYGIRAGGKLLSPKRMVVVE